MKPNVKQEFQEAMDQLHFSGQEKAAMTQRLLNQMKQKPTSFSGRKLLILSLAAVLILSTMTAAAVYTHWPKGTEQCHQYTEQEKQAAEKSGFSVLPQETKPSPTNKTPQVVSATDQGITISVVQTLMDQDRATLIFRIDGFELPDGEFPSADGCEISLDGQPYGFGSRFFDGIIESKPGVYTYADGSPCQTNEYGVNIARPVASDGSIEFIVDLIFNEPQPLSTDITVHFSEIGIQDDLEQITIVKGDWTLSWTLTGTNKTRTLEPNAPIADTGITLRRVTLTPLSATMVFEGGTLIDMNQFDEDDTNADNTYPAAWTWEWAPMLLGVMLKDGTYVASPPTGGGMWVNEDESFTVNTGIQVVDIDQIAALVFHSRDGKFIDGVYVPGEHYVVPIS